MATPSLPTVSDNEREIIFALGHLVFQWNLVEGAFGRLLTLMLPGRTIKETLSAQIVTAELGAVGIENALNSFARDILPAEIGGRIEHAIQYFKRLREYRNFYVHGIMGILSSDRGPEGVIHTVSAKGTLKVHPAFVSRPDIEAITAHAACLRSFVDALADRHAGGSPSSSLPDKPSLPDPLVKPHQLLRGWILPPGSSEA